MIRILLLAALAPALSGCFITNAAGNQPSRSYTGDELRALIARNTAVGWMLGGEQYIDSKKGILEEGDSLTPLGEYSDFPKWFNTAFLMAYNSTPIKTGRFYREKDADECLELIQFMSVILTRSYLDQAQSPRTVVTTGGASVDMKFVLERDFQAAILITQIALDQCRFRETGQVIESKDYSL